MNSKSKLGISALLILIVLVGLSHFNPFHFAWSETFKFSFEKEESTGLKSVVEESLRGKKGMFAVYIEELPASPSAVKKEDPGLEVYSQLENDVFPSASLYKLILLAAVLKEVENGRIDLEETITSSKTHLADVLGGIDFGYEQAPEKISYTVKESMQRVGRISDNFAAIMLTEKLQQLPHKDGEEGLLIAQTKELGMIKTDFLTEPITTTASDIGTFFRKLYAGEVVSPKVSQEIIKLLSLSRINDRLPALLPEGVKVIHKTGELAHIRHDAGIVFPTMGNPYVLVVLGKELKYEDNGVETIAQLSKDVYGYFTNKADKGN